MQNKMEKQGKLLNNTYVQVNDPEYKNVTSYFFQV